MQKSGKELYSNLTVMLVEDEASHRMILRRNLERGLGVNVLECSDGRSAIQMLKRNEPHLIILDINLPDIDGDALLNRIRADKKTSHIPVIVCTANSGREAIMRMMALSIDGFVVKPFSGETICAKVQSTFDRFLRSEA